MEILRFVKAGEIDPIFFEKSYYVVPDAGGGKPYALLRKAMIDTSFHAVAKVAMHSREHIVIIRPSEDGLVLHTMYFVNELHKANRGAKATDAKFGTKEIELAKRLIDALASPFKPEQFKDEYRGNVERLIEEKRKGRPVTAVEHPKTAPVVDIMDALRRSLGSKAAPAKPSAKAAGKRAHKAA
jgi:DNA end-binding protein Ku